jgi:hypothetical protein
LNSDLKAEGLSFDANPNFINEVKKLSRGSLLSNNNSQNELQNKVDEI